MKIGDIDTYFFAYNCLHEELKDAFLDICSFFEGWDWDTVENIVGESELDMLKSRALITRDINGVASVHDVILTIGRQKAQGMGFKFASASQIIELLDEKEEKVSN